MVTKPITNNTKHTACMQNEKRFDELNISLIKNTLIVWLFCVMQKRVVNTFVFITSKSSLHVFIWVDSLTSETRAAILRPHHTVTVVWLSFSRTVCLTCGYLSAVWSV